MALAISTTPALAQSKGLQSSPDHAKLAPPAGQIKAAAPKGFEDFDSTVSTEFDLTFQGRKIGSFAATFKDGSLVFADPAKVAAALGPDVDTDTAAAFLSKSLPGNEQYRCRPGQLTGCGILPGGVSGVIVNVDTFQVSLFLAREYLLSTIAPARVIGPPTSSGPALIQGVRFSGATSGGKLRYGGTFDTLASIGQTALVAETTLSDVDGFRAQQIYAQRVWADRRAAIGVLQDFQSLNLTSYRVAGAEFGSFYGTLVDSANDTATPVEVLLPKRAQVEIYRDNVLISTAQYQPGLQLIDTRNLPDGSYTIHIIVRDGGQVLLDQTRPFSKIANLVPPGKIGFRFRVGERLRDGFLDSGSNGIDRSFIPKGTGELVASGSIQRRLGNSLAGSLTVTSFDSRVFSEAGLQLFRGKVSGIVSGGLGSDGLYSAQVSASVQFPWASFYLAARTTHVDNNGVLQIDPDRYQPFFRSQKYIFGSAQFRALGGSFSLTGSFTRSAQFPDRYAVGVQYSRSLRLPFFGTALLSAGATKSDFDSRVGVTIAFFKQIDRKTDASFTAGGQYIPDSSSIGGRKGLSPVAEATVTRNEQLGPVDLIGQVGGSTDADSDRVFGQLRAQSPYGSADVTAQLQSRTSGDTDRTVLFNAQSGFVLGGGGFKLGLRNPADSFVVLDLSSLKAEAPAATPAATPAEASTDGATSGTLTKPAGKSINPNEPTKVAAGGYRITINSKPLDYIEPGQRVAVGLPAYKQYTIGLKPEGAPQFDLSGTEKTVTLYPGNVDRIRFQAQRVISIYGQVVDARGAPLVRARVEAGGDYAIADDRGYFTVTAPLTATMSIRTSAGAGCLERLVGSVVDAKDPALLYRFGKLQCSQSIPDVPPAAPVAAPSSAPATAPVRAPMPAPAPAAPPPAKTSAVEPRAVLRTASYTPVPQSDVSAVSRTDCSKAGGAAAQSACETLATQRANTEELARVSNRARSLVDNLSGSGPVALADAESSLAILVAQSFLRQAALEEIPGDVPLY